MANEPKYHSGDVVSIDFLKVSKPPTFTELQLELQRDLIKLDNLKGKSIEPKITNP